MSELKDACHELEQTMAQVEAECQVILACLDEFENYASLYVIVRLIKKLTILDQWVVSETVRLYKEHHGTGYVCVFLTQLDGIVACWVEDERIVANKARFASFGSTVISPEVAKEVIHQLTEHLQSNDWPRVVDWLSRYGKSPGLDLNQRLEDG